MPTNSVATELYAAIRALRRAPLISGSAILCIGLGIGATTAISSAINRALLQPLPFREPERLVTVYRTTPHFDTGPFCFSSVRTSCCSRATLARCFNTAGCFSV